MSNLTDDPNDPRLTRGGDQKPGPQADVYLVLSKEERAKEFVRPLRSEYVHVWLKPVYPLRDLTDEEKERWWNEGYVKFEVYPKSMAPRTGKFWTQAELDNDGCGTRTIMGPALSETYARNPKFYGYTYCCGCKMHLSVAEFVWEIDGEVVGS